MPKPRSIYIESIYIDTNLKIIVANRLGKLSSKNMGLFLIVSPGVA